MQVNSVDVTVCVTEVCYYKANKNRESSAEVSSHQADKETTSHLIVCSETQLI